MSNKVVQLPGMTTRDLLTRNDQFIPSTLYHALPFSLTPATLNHLVRSLVQSILHLRGLLPCPYPTLVHELCRDQAEEGGEEGMDRRSARVEHGYSRRDRQRRRGAEVGIDLLAIGRGEGEGRELRVPHPPPPDHSP